MSRSPGRGESSTRWVVVGAVSTAILAIVGVVSLVFGPQIFGRGESTVRPPGSSVGGSGPGPRSPTETTPPLASGPAYLDTLAATNDQPKTGVAYISGREFKESLYYVAAGGAINSESGDAFSSHYDLGGRYGHFSAIIGLGTEPGYQVEFEAFVDGHRLIDTVIHDDGTAVPITMKVSGGHDLELTVTLRDVIAYANDTTIVWGDAKIGP